MSSDCLTIPAAFNVKTRAIVIAISICAAKAKALANAAAKVGHVSVSYTHLTLPTTPYV